MSTDPALQRRLITVPGIPLGRARISHATVWGELVFVSGLVARDPATGAAMPGGAGIQTRQILENMKLVLGAAGSSMSLVLKVGCFLQDMAQFGAFNDVWDSYFQEAPPARICVQAAIGPGYEVEIDAIAGRGAR